MYVDYAYYKGIFCGKMTENEFIEHEMSAEAYIRSITYINGDIFAGDSEDVKKAVCAVADIYQKESQKQEHNHGRGQIKSENNDGYSVSYVTEQTDGQTSEELLKKKAYNTAYGYLLPTGWLSRKVRYGHADKCRHNDL